MWRFNVSVGRAIWMGGHLVNTFLLMAALTLTAWWSQGKQPLRLRQQGAVGWTLLAAVLGMLVLGVSGAITALGDTLMLTGGISPQENALVATLVELRIFHPLIAIAVGFALVGSRWDWVAMKQRPGRGDAATGQAIIILFIVSAS